jgi:hypothetical protein
MAGKPPEDEEEGSEGSDGAEGAFGGAVSRSTISRSIWVRMDVQSYLKVGRREGECYVLSQNTVQSCFTST